MVENCRHQAQCLLRTDAATVPSQLRPLDEVLEQHVAGDVAAQDLVERNPVTSGSAGLQEKLGRQRGRAALVFS